MLQPQLLPSPLSIPRDRETALRRFGTTQQFLYCIAGLSDRKPRKVSHAQGVPAYARRTSALIGVGRLDRRAEAGSIGHKIQGVLRSRPLLYLLQLQRPMLSGFP
jgi:hypothetical protein